MTAASIAFPAAARTRLLLEGPIVATLLRLTPADLVVNVILAVVAIGGWIATQSLDAGLIGLGIVTFAGLVAMGSVLSLAFPLYANLGPKEAK